MLNNYHTGIYMYRNAGCCILCTNEMAHFKLFFLMKLVELLLLLDYLVSWVLAMLQNMKYILYVSRNCSCVQNRMLNQSSK